MSSLLKRLNSESKISIPLDKEQSRRKTMGAFAKDVLHRGGTSTLVKAQKRNSRSFEEEEAEYRVIFDLFDKGTIELMTKPTLAMMTEEEFQEYKAMFQMFDKDNSGSITASEFEHATKSMGLSLNSKEIQDIIREVDKNNNGNIDFEEFCVVMKKMSSKKNSWDDVIKRCFDVFDKNGSGVIRETEFHDILFELGGIHDEVLIEEIFNQADVDGNGVIEYEEFTSFCKNYLTDEDVESSAK